MLSRSDKNCIKFMQKIAIVHGESYDYSKMVYVNSGTKIIIICKTHGEFLQTPDSHSRGTGCPKCGRIFRGKRKRKPFSIFMKESHLQHNFKFKYIEESYSKLNADTKIICPTHGEFSQNASSHLAGAGCKKCGIEKRVLDSTTPKIDFVNKANAKYNDLFDYSLFVYKSCDGKSTIICKVHGKFQQTPWSHLKCKFGCHKCAIEHRANFHRKLPIELASLKKKIKRRAKIFLLGKGYTKNTIILETIGCTLEEFKTHLEQNPYNFKSDCLDMDLDHIVPLCTAKVEEDFIKLNHYTNFQLLPSYYNQFVKRTKEFDRINFEKWLKETNYNKC